MCLIYVWVIFIYKKNQSLIYKSYYYALLNLIQLHTFSLMSPGVDIDFTIHRDKRKA